MPAATTNNVPYCAVNALTANDIGSLPSVGAPPSDRFTAVAPEAAAHSIPAMIADSGQLPSSVHTLPTSNRASGAIPRYRAPLPAMIDAVCVPCPYPSRIPVPVKSRVSATAPRSGCEGSQPPSRSAIVTPLPVIPASHAAGAPT